MYLEWKIRIWPMYKDRWQKKAQKVIRMRKLRREFLGQIFKREFELMVAYYQKKKKTGKKLLAKIMAIKPHNLEKILDDYFYQVCYNFYKR